MTGWISSMAFNVHGCLFSAHSSVILTVHPVCLSLFLSLCSSLFLGFSHCVQISRRSQYQPSPLLLQSVHQLPIRLQLPHVPKIKLNIWVSAHNTFPLLASLEVPIRAPYHISVVLFSGKPECQCTSSTLRYCSNSMWIDRSWCKSNKSPTAWFNLCLKEEKKRYRESFG